MAKSVSNTFPPLDPLAFMDSAPAEPVVAQPASSADAALAAVDSDAAGFFAHLRGAGESAAPAFVAKKAEPAPVPRPAFGASGRPKIGGVVAAPGRHEASPHATSSDGSAAPVAALLPSAPAPQGAPFRVSGGRPNFGKAAPSAAAREQNGNDMPHGTNVPADEAAIGDHSPEELPPVVSGGTVAPPEFSMRVQRGRPNFGNTPKDEPHSCVEPPKGLFAGLPKDVSKQVRALRQDIKAASIVTEMVAVMALHPGSAADIVVKQKALTSLLALARRSAEDLVGQVDPAHADAGWVKSQALSMTAHVLANTWGSCAADCTFDEVRDEFERHMAVVSAVLADDSGEVAMAVDAFAEGDYYKKVDNAQTAADHRLVSIHAAAWSFAETVGSVLDEDDDTFSFGLEPEVVVQALLQKTFEIVSASRPEISDSDAAITYWRGAMRRASTLVGAEYSKKAAETLLWIEDVDGPDRASRLSQCPALFERQAAPFILEWGMMNFQAIERASKKLIEDVSDVQKTADRPSR